jgi:hypothetical protein
MMNIMMKRVFSSLMEMYIAADTPVVILCSFITGFIAKSNFPAHLTEKSIAFRILIELM